MSAIEPEEFARIIVGLSPALILYARSFCSEPEDMVQEALLRLFQQTTQPENKRAWLFRCVRNLAINSQRAQTRRSRHQTAHSEQSSRWFDATCERELDVQVAVAALEHLPGELREIISARLWGELTLAEIAELTELSISTVFRRYELGLHQLRIAIGAACPPTITQTHSSSFLKNSKD